MNRVRRHNFFENCSLGFGGPKVKGSSHAFFRDMLCVVAISLIHMAINGYYFKSEPALIFTLVKAYTYPDIYPGDMIHTFEIKSLLIPILSIFEKLHCLEYAAFWGYVCGLIAFYFVSLRIARLISRNKHSEFLFILFLVFAKPILGGSTTFLSYFSYSTIAASLMLFVIYLMLQEKSVLAGVLLGLLWNVHLLSAFPVYIFFALFMVWGEFKNKKSAVVGSIGALLISLPLITIWKLSSSLSIGSLFVDPAWYTAFKMRSGHIFFPFFNQYNIDAVIFFIVAMLGVLILPYKDHYRRKVYIIVFASFALCVLSFIVVHLKPIAVVLQLQLYRTAFFIVFFALILFSDHVMAIFRSSGLFLKGVAALTALALILYKIIPFLGLLNIWLFFQISRGRKNSHDFFSFIAKLILIIGMINLLIIVRLKTNSRIYAFQGKKGLSVEIDFPWLDSWDKEFLPEWIDIQMWAKHNTPRDAVFIIPPYMKDFRYRSERAIVGNWKDGTLGIYDRAFALEWISRMKDLRSWDDDMEFWGSTPHWNFKRAFTTLDEQEFTRLAGKYRAHFLVVEQEVILNFEEVYSNGRFHVYRMPG